MVSSYSQLYTLDQLKTQNQSKESDSISSSDGGSNSSSDNALVLINNQVYDVKEFSEVHPGGKVILSYANGQDATDPFNAFHPESAHEVLANFYVGDLHPDDVTKIKLTAGVDSSQQPLSQQQSTKLSFAKAIEDYRQHITRLGYFESDKLFYLWKNLQILGVVCLSVLTLCYKPDSVFNVVASAMLLGVAWQQSGWLAHDYLHHQVYQNRSINNLFGYLWGNVFQGFSVAWWKNKHNTHHSHPNVHNHDPDVDTMPVLGWSKYAIADYVEQVSCQQAKRKAAAAAAEQQLDGPQASSTRPISVSKLVKYLLYNQATLYFIVLTFARLSWAEQSLEYALAMKSNYTSKWIELATLSSHWMLYFYFIGSVISTWPLMVLYVIVSQCTCGLLLAFVFSLNHNGMPIYTQDESSEMSFYELQIQTGRDVIPTVFSTWFTGGLNYQIEHHLFPSLPRHRLPLVSAKVRELCLQHSIPYHVTSFSEGTKEILNRLDHVSSVAQMLLNAEE
ncbi:hypothetical protein MP228_005932 [Amoeboaphelidium protococcarum]|nr:hypothetical protein MP228_005932 [Amoeboaphelidium protococcarum]